MTDKRNGKPDRRRSDQTLTVDERIDRVWDALYIIVAAVLIGFLLNGYSVIKSVETATTAKHVSANNSRILREIGADRRFRNLATTLRDAAMGACERLQAQRERSNTSDARQFLILNTAAHDRVLPAAVRRSYGFLASTTQYGPPTNCPVAVLHPRKYRPPAYIPYTQLGGQFAMRVTRAAKNLQPQPVPSQAHHHK